jgi:alpha-glucosidase
MPLYVRAGAILPMQPLVQHTGEIPNGPLQLRVYPGNDCSGLLYQDDGHSFAYQKGEILRISYWCAVSPASVTITSTIQKNAFKPWWNSTELTIYGVTAAPKEVRISDQVIRDWRFDSSKHTVTLTVPVAASNWSVRVDF